MSPSRLLWQCKYTAHTQPHRHTLTQRDEDTLYSVFLTTVGKKRINKGGEKMAQRGTTYPPPLLKVYEPTLSNEQMRLVQR